MDFNSKHKSSEIEEILDSVGGKQEKLVSGTNIKTINGESILGTGDITIKERELEKYATDKSWSIVASSPLELLANHPNAPDGTKAMVVASANSIYGVSLFDFFMGTIEGVENVILNANAYTLKISAVDTSVELPISNTDDVRVVLPFNSEITITMGADLASVYEIQVRKGFNETVWSSGSWFYTGYLIGNQMPVSNLFTLDDNSLAGLMAISPALIVDFVGTKTITEYVKNGDNWEVWSEGESGLNTKLNTWLKQIAQLLPTKTSQLENDSNFVSSNDLKTINGQSIVGSGNITIDSGGGGTGDSSVFITHFTPDEFASGYVEFTDEQVEAIRNAARQNKIIALPTSSSDGYTGLLVSSYGYFNYDEDGVWSLHLTIIHNGASYSNWIRHYHPFFSLQYAEVTPFKPLVERVLVDEDGLAVADSYGKDNLIIIVEGYCRYLIINECGFEYGTTVRFFTGEDCTIEYWGYWANGVIPTIEPYTAYEMQMVYGANGYPCAVLTPFKPVE